MKIVQMDAGMVGTLLHVSLILKAYATHYS